MAFRRRNVVISRVPDTKNTQGSKESVSASNSESIRGTRPSPIDGRLTTSTGTPSLDSALAGHGGLALGNSILLEESGTTDFAGALLRHFAAEGVVQGHKVHVVGLSEHWGRELPGLVGPAEVDNINPSKKSTEKLKIAWRYQALGDSEIGGGGSSRVPIKQTSGSSKGTQSLIERPDFCHVFDLAKRLDFPPGATIDYIQISTTGSNISPFTRILEKLATSLASPQSRNIHRLVIPTILSPAIYPPQASAPHNLLKFIHGLRGLLRQYPNQLTAMITLPLALYPRSSDMVRWFELLSDGVIELTPFPHLLDPGSAGTPTTSGGATAQEDQPQGMVKIHKLPVLHERGGGHGSAIAGLGDDFAFVVSRRKFLIKPFNLPPADGDTDAQHQGPGHGDSGSTPASKAQMEF